MAAARLRHAHDHREQRRGVRAALSMYFVLLALLLAAIVAGLAGASPPALDGLWCIVSSAVVAVFWLLRRPRAAMLPSNAWRWCIRSVALGVGTFTAGLGLVVLVSLATRGVALPQQADSIVFGDQIALAILCMCVQPAVFEELAFRGVIFDGLRRAMGPKETIAATAVLFMTIHLNLVMLPMLLLAGLALGWLRWRTNALAPGMVMHFTHNLLVLASSFSLHGGI